MVANSGSTVVDNSLYAATYETLSRRITARRGSIAKQLPAGPPRTHHHQRQPAKAGQLKTTQERSAGQPDRTGDRLLQLPEISERTTLEEATLRWKRHRGELPFVFKLGRRLVAWERDVLAWIDEQQAKDAEDRASATG